MYTQTETGINLSDGSFVQAYIDLEVGPIKLIRTHLGGPVVPYSKAFGPSWSHNFEMYIRTVPSGAPINTFYSDVHVDTGVYTFSGDADHVVSSPWNDDAKGNKLEKIGSVLRFTARSGTIYEFALASDLYHIVKQVYPNGRTLDFFYNDDQKLKEVRDSSGYAVIFDYAGNGFVADACAVNMALTAVSPSASCGALGQSKQLAVYGYSAATGGDLLTSAVDRVGQTTIYQYNNPSVSQPAISCVIPPGYSTCKIANAYGSSSYYYQVTQQTLATGELWKFSYTGIFSGKRLRNSDGGANSTSTTVTDPLGKIATYGFTDSSPFSVTDANNHTTSYTYIGNEWKTSQTGASSGTYLAQTKLPEGNKFVASFDDRMNVNSVTAVDKSGTQMRANSSSFPASGSDGLCGVVDPKVCNQPTWTRSPSGNQTDYTYDTASGGPSTIMGPPPMSGSPRPLKVFTYTPRAARISDTGGSPVSGSTIWLLAQETQCQTSAANPDSPVCDASAQQMTTTYDYGAPGSLSQLLLTTKVETASGTSRRTCYAYDWQGRKISETAPRANLSVCP